MAVRICFILVDVLILNLLFYNNYKLFSSDIYSIFNITDSSGFSLIWIEPVPFSTINLGEN